MKKYKVKAFLWVNRKGKTILRYGILADGACACVNPFYNYIDAIGYIIKVESGKISEPISG